MSNMTTRSVASAAERAAASTYLWGHTGSAPSTDRRFGINDFMQRDVDGNYLAPWGTGEDPYFGIKFSTTYMLAVQFRETDRSTRIISKSGDGTGFVGVYTGTSENERARWTPTGEFRLGTTGAIAAPEKCSILTSAEIGLTVKNTANANSTALFWNSDNTGNNLFVSFLQGAGFQVGNISYNRVAGLTAYNTTSDYRAKDVRGPVEQEDVGHRIDNLEIVMATMKGATIERPMVIAHQAQEAGFGFAVTGKKDATETFEIRDEDGEVIGTEERDLLQGVDYSAFVPDLLAEVKFLRARVAALEKA